MMPSLEKISYYVKFLDKVQDNLEKGGCYMQNVIDAKISIQNKKNVNGMKTWDWKADSYEDLLHEQKSPMEICYY